jgi:uncharacterized protein (TIGR02453 family)
VGKDVHGPGFYLHLEPDRVFAGAGIWHPDSKTAGKVRSAIVERERDWKKIRPTVLEGDSLKRPPRGFDADHPLIEDLKRKDFFTLTRFTESEATAPHFLERYTKSCRAASRFMAFLTKAVGLPY